MKTRFFALAMLALALVACNNDNENLNGDPVAAQFTADIAPATRASGTTWTAGDRIGITDIGNDSQYGNVPFIFASMTIENFEWRLACLLISSIGINHHDTSNISQRDVFHLENGASRRKGYSYRRYSFAPTIRVNVISTLRHAAERSRITAIDSLASEPRESKYPRSSYRGCSAVKNFLSSSHR